MTHHEPDDVGSRLHAEGPTPSVGPSFFETLAITATTSTPTPTPRWPGRVLKSKLTALLAGAFVLVSGAAYAGGLMGGGDGPEAAPVVPVHSVEPNEQAPERGPDRSAPPDRHDAGTSGDRRSGEGSNEAPVAPDLSTDPKGDADADAPLPERGPCRFWGDWNDRDWGDREWSSDLSRELWRLHDHPSDDWRRSVWCDGPWGDRDWDWDDQDWGDEEWDARDWGDQDWNDEDRDHDGGDGHGSWHDDDDDQHW